MIPLLPDKNLDKPRLTIARMLTPLGAMVAGALDEGICLLEFLDQIRLEDEREKWEKIFRAECIPGSHPHLDALQQELEKYYNGSGREFQLPLVIIGTDFQKKVWSSLQSIPYGTTRSYQAQAEMIGNPKAVRAVANANGQNRIAIIIPCHRVIGKDGGLTGYGGGLWRKKYLLEHEQKFINPSKTKAKSKGKNKGKEPQQGN